MTTQLILEEFQLNSPNVLNVNNNVKQKLNLKVSYGAFFPALIVLRTLIIIVLNVMHLLEVAEKIHELSKPQLSIIFNYLS